jgi:hypothetical protein
MKLPVLESIISGEYCKRGEYVFPKYKVRRGSFDWNDPFNITTIDICGAMRRAPWDFNAVKNFSFSSRPLFCVKEEYKTQQNEKLCEQINREMKLMCEQVECFLKEYDDSEKLEWMCMDIVESLVCYALDAYENIHSLGYFIGVTAMEFSFAYRQFFLISSFDSWCEMKFSFLFSEDEALREIYDELVDKRMPKKELATTPAVADNIPPQNIDDKIAEARRRLEFLNYEYKGKRFMSEGDYRRMLSWVEVLIREGKCPEQAGALTLGHSKDWVKYTLYLIQKEVMNFKKDDEWVRLAWIIGGSEGEFSTIKTKFSTAPKVVKNRVVYDEVVSKLVEGVR